MDILMAAIACVVVSHLLYGTAIAHEQQRFKRYQEENKAFERRLACRKCYYYFGGDLVCAVRPGGIYPDECPDFKPKPLD